MEPDADLIALGIQQPWAELILRGIKTIEVRTVGTRIRGPIYLYASRRLSRLDAARVAMNNYGLDAVQLPLGRLVGTVDIVETRAACPEDGNAACLPPALLAGRQCWLLSNPQRSSRPLEARYMPYGMWFYPFRRVQAPGKRGVRHGRT